MALAPRFQGDPADHATAWAQLWKEKVTPWDRSESSPALVDLLQREMVICHLKTDAGERSRTALVPGCGRGYDVALLANELKSSGFDNVVGLEVSPGAVEAAESYLRELGSPSGANVLLQDFFSDEAATMFSGKVDLIYDYTFLCALHPSRRSAWAERMRLMIAPGGLLVTLQHPLDNHEGGPPFSLSPAIYDGLLLPDFDLVLHEKPKRSFNLKLSEHDMIGIYRRKSSYTIDHP